MKVAVTPRNKLCLQLCSAAMAHARINDDMDSDLDSEESEYGEATELEESDNLFQSSDDDEFEGFVYNVGREVKWTRGQPPTIRPREVRAKNAAGEPVRNPGVHVAVNDSWCPFDFFKLFLTLEFVRDVLVHHTNLKAQIRRAQRGDNGNWTETNGEEMFAFLACLFVMNDFVGLPSSQPYFMTDRRKLFLHSNSLGQIFSRHRFTQLKRYFSIQNPTTVNPPKGEQGNDPLFKVRPLIDLLSTNFRSVYQPQRQVLIDETMVPFKGRLAYKQRIPSKPVRDGIKIFQLTESPSGYSWSFEIYAGKRQGEDQIAGDLGVTGLVVTQLLWGLEFQNYEPYTDNFYTSIPLALFLQERGIRLCGTIRANRKYLPKAIIQAGKQLKNRGDIVYASSGNLLFLVWKDRKPVSFLSSLHNADLGEVMERNCRDAEGNHAKLAVNCPQIVHDYNAYMMGVDKNDQVCRIRKDQKQLKWYLRLTIKLLIIAVYNAYHIEDATIKPHRSADGKTVRSLLTFKEELIRDMIGNIRTPPESLKRRRSYGSATANEELRLSNVGVHLPEKGEGH